MWNMGCSENEISIKALQIIKYINISFYIFLINRLLISVSKWQMLNFHSICIGVGEYIKLTYKSRGV